MRIPTFYQFQRQAEVISKQFNNMSKLQQQMSSGLKLINYSDDPVLANQIQSSNDYLDQLHSYDKNGIMAQKRNKMIFSLTQTAVGTMGDVLTQLQRVQGTTLSDATKANIASQIQGDLNTLLNMANTQDENGKYIFSGSNTNIQPFIKTDGSYQYQGGYDASFIDIGTSAQALYYESGYKVFGDIPLGNGYFTTTAAATNTGGASTSAGTINPATYVADTYTVSFVQDAGKTCIQVVGASSGQVIPPSGGSPVVYTGAGQGGMDLNFNGITINVSGAANVGDSFQLEPSSGQSAFDTIQGVIDLLNNPVTNQGIFDQLIRQASASFGQISNQFINYQAQLGSSAQAINSAVKTNGSTISYQEILLGDLQNADMAKVISELSQQQLALEATQQSYLKLQETFNQLLKI